MRIPEGWQKIRNWLVPKPDSVCPALRRGDRAACGATKQAPSPCSTLGRFEFGADRPNIREPEQPRITVVDKLGRYGFDQLERAVLEIQAGDTGRILELVDWVERAHKRLKMFALLGASGEPSIQALQAAHPVAVCELERLLAAQATIRSGQEVEARAALKRRLPGLVFPRAGSRSELEELIAASRNINCWLATHGTFACGCRALTPNEIH